MNIIPILLTLLAVTVSAQFASSYSFSDGGFVSIPSAVHYRHRRDVSESSSESENEHKPTNEYLPPMEEEKSAVLADDGYQYKTVRRLRYRYRNRRDVSELYLPPHHHEDHHEDHHQHHYEHQLHYVHAVPSIEHSLPSLGHHHSEVISHEYLPPVEHHETAILADDGYHYKTAKKARKFRRH